MTSAAIFFLLDRLESSEMILRNITYAVMHFHNLQALVLCPTRELAKQCESVANEYFGHQLRTTCLFGGGERSRQIHDLRRGKYQLVMK